MIIALNGRAGSGKDTAADYLVQNHNYKKLSFADSLKDFAAKTFEIPRNYFDDRDLKDSALEQYPVSPKDGVSKLVCNELFQYFKTIDNKKAVNVMLNKNTGFLEGFFIDGMKNMYHTPRSILLVQGAMARSINPDYWINTLINKINTQENIVITDLRFANEANALQANFPEVRFVRIDRFDTIPNIDSSERDLDNYKFHAIINNRESTSDLFNKIEDYIKA